MARQRSLGTHRYQLRALSSIARFLPVFVGVLLASVFSLSVLRDEAQVARIAFEVGNELLGLYGGFGVIALPFLFLVTARLRRGKSSQVTFVELRRDEIVIELAAHSKRAERTLRIPLRRVRGGYSHATADGRVRVNLELSGGLNEGDRIELDLDPDVAEPLVRKLVGQAPEFELTRSGLRFDAALGALSVGSGFAAASWLAERIHEHAPGSVAGASLAMGWSIGLGVAAIGLMHALLSLVFAPRRILVGVDGLRIDGVFRRRFLGYESISAVRATSRALVITDRDGRTTWLIAPGVDSSRLSAIARLASERLSPGAPSGPALPAWQPGTLRRWREAILKSVDATSYRDGSLSDGDLASYLSAPGVSRERRVAAAIALASRGEGEVKQSIRIAATCLADDSTRRILERVAEDEDDDDALETLLAARRAPAYHKQL